MVRRFAVLKDNMVINITMSEIVLYKNWIESEIAQMGDSYDSETGKFSTSQQNINRDLMVVTMRQARLALLAEGILSTVNDAIAAMDSPAKEAAEITWEYATEVKRLDPLVIQLGSFLELSEEQLDNLFVVAATL